MRAPCRTFQIRVGILALSTAACSFAPPYHVPSSGPAPAHYQELDGWKVSEPRDTLPRGAWWTLYQDTELDQLEDEFKVQNLSLKAAVARLEQARAQYRIARADLFPSVNADASATRNRLSPNGPKYLPAHPTDYDDFLLGADLSYEVDLWGRVRNQVTAAKANRQASAADLASVELALRAQLAGDYLNLRVYDAEIQLLAKTVEDYAQALKIETDLYNGGAAALSDVAQAQAELETARSQAADVRLQRAQALHAIAVLVGENPSEFRLAANPLPPQAGPPSIDPGLPGDLLERRPDIAEAERRVAAYNAQIGVARAAYFPQFTLGGSGGVESLSTSNWITAPSRFWSIGPEVTLPIFQGGRLIAQTAQAQAQYQEQVANYRNAVLTAYQDVEDNLAALRELQAQSATDEAAVKANEVASHQARDRYRAGIVTYLEVTSTETTLLQSELAAASVQARRMNASVLLVKALGGGWQNQPPMLGKQ